jgi:hypothetical protein
MLAAACSLFGFLAAACVRYSPAQTSALLSWLPWLAAGTAVTCGVWLRWKRSSLVVAVAAAGVLLAFLRLDAVRTVDRYRIYAEAARLEAFDVHPLSSSYASAWPVWQHLDGQPARRIAVSAGWDPPAGHNWYLYPLLGSRLQNQLVNVTTGVDPSEVRSRWNERRPNEKIWLDGMQKAAPDFLFLLYPPSEEAGWVDNNPEVFQVEPVPGATTGQLYRVMITTRPLL